MKNKYGGRKFSSLKSLKHKLTKCIDLYQLPCFCLWVKAIESSVVCYNIMQHYSFSYRGLRITAPARNFHKMQIHNFEFFQRPKNIFTHQMNLTSSRVSCSLEQDGRRVAKPASVASVTVAANASALVFGMVYKIWQGVWKVRRLSVFYKENSRWPGSCLWHSCPFPLLLLKHDGWRRET